MHTYYSSLNFKGRKLLILIVQHLCFLILFPFLLNAQPKEAPMRLKKEMFINDIKKLLNTMEAVHCGPYRYISAQRLASSIDTTVNALPDIIDRKRAIYTMKFLVSLLNEGHCFVPDDSLITDKLNQFPVFPLGINHSDGNYLYVSCNYSTNKTVSRGDRIITINDIDAQKLYAGAISLEGGLYTNKASLVNDNFPYYLYFLDVHPPYKISFLPKDDSITRTITMEGVLYPKVKPEPKADYSYAIIEKDIGYIDFVNMNDLSSFKKFIASSFCDIKSRGIKKLIIDIRKNGGGDDILGEYLLSFLTTGKIRMLAAKDWKASWQMKERRLQKSPGEWVTSEYKALMSAPVGTIVHFQYEPRRKFPMPTCLFNGKVCFLTGPYTFSAANELAEAAKTYHAGVLIGQPTGEPASALREGYTYEMPYSKIRVIIPIAFEWRANSTMKDSSPVYPDIPVSQSEINQSWQKVDTVLQKAVEWLE